MIGEAAVVVDTRMGDMDSGRRTEGVLVVGEEGLEECMVVEVERGDMMDMVVGVEAVAEEEVVDTAAIGMVGTGMVMVGDDTTVHSQGSTLP